MHFKWIYALPIWKIWSCQLQMAVQVKPDITPEEFLKEAQKTGRIIRIQREGKDFELGIILDPRALIEEIKNK